MILKCAACGGDMEISDDLPKGSRVKCPYCGERSQFDRPHRIELPQGENLPRFSRNEVAETPEPMQEVPQKPKLHVRRQNMPVTHAQPTTLTGACPPQRIPSQGNSQSNSKRKGSLHDTLIYVALALVLGGAVACWLKSSKRGNEEEQHESVTGMESAENRDRVDQEEAERKIRAERLAQDKAERERRRVEKEKRDAERDRQRQEMADKVEKERQLRDLLVKVETGFCGAKTVFATDFPEKERPFSFAEDGELYVADLDCVAERLFYKLKAAKGLVKSVQRISRREGMTDVEVDKFMETVKDKVVLARREGGPVWICGNVKSNMTFPIQDSSRTISPLADFMGDAFSIANALKVVLPAVKFRVTLKSKDETTVIKLGVVEKAVDIQQVRSKIRERITERKLRACGSGLKPPKMKKYKRTVLFADDERCKRAIVGITKVPREFQFHGTSRYNDGKRHVQDIINRARAKWEKQKAEAERQEREELETEAENRRLMDEYRRKVDNRLNGSKATESEVDVEMADFKLFVERSRSKLPKE